MARTQWTDATARPLMREHGLEPDPKVPFATVKTPWPVTCLVCGHQSTPTFNDVRRGHGCRSCAGLAPLTEDEALEALEFVRYEPVVPYPGERLARWEVRCTICGTVTFTTLASARKGAGCKICAPRRQGDKRLAESAAIAAVRVEELDLDATEPYPGALAKWRLHCRRCSQDIQPRFYKMVDGWACPSCRAAATMQEKLDRARHNGWAPLWAEDNGVGQWTLLHSCGFIHNTVPWDIGRVGEGCPSCSTFGFNPTNPGFIYLLELPEHAALKIGISGDTPRRTSQHLKNYHAEVVAVWGPYDGFLVRRVEEAVKHSWAGYRTPASLAGMPGWTETVSTEDVSAEEATAAVDALLNITRPVFDPLSRPVFDPSLYSVAHCDRQEALGVIGAGHYTGTLPASTLLLGLHSLGSLCGVAAFGTPSYPGVAASIWPEGGRGSVIELRRLYLLDNVGANAESWFLARSIKALRLLRPEVRVVVAFSDPSAGHHGGVYQATNFLYLGRTPPSYHYRSESGAYVHKRVPWNRGRDRGTSEAEEAQGLYRVKDAPKYRYVYPLTRRAREVLGARSLPYPKPDVEALAAANYNGPAPLVESRAI